MATEVATKKTRLLGWMFFALFVLLIALGIIAKRMYHHADWVIFFHLPAAVFLVLGFYRLSAKVRQAYRESL